MVRVVSQSFNHPRSRHSSGETTDFDLALRADSALALTLRAKRTDLLDCESSSDSFWDSEFDTDYQEHLNLNKNAEDDVNGNCTSASTEKSDVTTKRKERRRERNKVSAQAYRQRKRQDNNSTHQELSMLEERNKQLLKQVRELEEKTDQAKQFLKGQGGSFPDCLFPLKTEALSAPSSPSVLLETQGSPENSNHSLSSPSPLSVNLNTNSHFSFDKTLQNTNTHSFMNSNLNSLNLNPPQTTMVNLNAPQVHSINLNIPQVNSINLNALEAEGCALANSEALLSPSAGLPVVKPKQNLFNANHYYKVPIHHPKVLRTVPEIPSNFSSDDDVNCLTLSNTPHALNSPGCINDKSKNCYSEANSCYGNMNLNMNERMGRTLMLNANKEKSGHSPNNVNALKTVNLNDNDNNLLLSNTSKPRLQSSPHLLVHPSDFVQLIIASGENSIPTK